MDFNMRNDKKHWQHPLTKIKENQGFTKIEKLQNIDKSQGLEILKSKTSTKARGLEILKSRIYSN